MANLMLAGRPTKQRLARPSPGNLGQALATRRYTGSVAAAPWRQGIELRSPRVFIDPPLAKAALAVDTNATEVLTYFVNRSNR